MAEELQKVATKAKETEKAKNDLGLLFFAAVVCCVFTCVCACSEDELAAVKETFQELKDERGNTVCCRVCPHHACVV